MRRIYEILANVYEHLQDDESREIFRLRCQYSLARDAKIFDEYVMRTPARSLLEKEKRGRPYIFGCGVYGKTLLREVKKDWQGFTDNNESLWGVIFVVSKSYHLKNYRRML